MFIYTPYGYQPFFMNQNQFMLYDEIMYDDKKLNLNVLPRQSGKTTLTVYMAKLLADSGESVLIVSPTFAMTRVLNDMCKFNDTTQLDHIDLVTSRDIIEYRTCFKRYSHVFLDEYEFFFQNQSNESLRKMYDLITILQTVGNYNVRIHGFTTPYSGEYSLTDKLLDALS